MRKMKHTPGPWHYDNGRIYAYIEFVAEVVTDADGHLMAAAPDLLAGTEKVVEQGHWEDCLSHAKVRAIPQSCDCPIGPLLTAIAKAKGQEI